MSQQQINARVGMSLVSVFTLLTACIQIPAVPETSLASSELAENRSVESDAARPDGEYLVAIDLVNTLVQVSGLEPGRIEVRLGQTRDPFGPYLVLALTRAGYVVQASDEESGAEIIDFKIDGPRAFDDPDSRLEATTYQIELGSAQLKRSYIFSDGLVKPQSPMFIRGVQATELVTDNSIFDPGVQRESAAYVDGVGETSATGVQIEANPDMQQAPELILRSSKEGGYQAGEPVEISLTASRDSNLFCFYQDGDGTIAKIYPNRFSLDNLLQAGEALHIPATGSWQMITTEAGKQHSAHISAAGFRWKVLVNPA